MPVEYGRHDVHYSRYDDSEPIMPRRFPDGNTRATRGDEHGHRAYTTYQPPVPPTQEARHVNVDKSPRPQFNTNEKSYPDYLANDHEFFSLASRILSSVGVFDSDENSNDREQSIATSVMLQKMLSPIMMKHFSDALDIRLKCMPKYPSQGESHFCTTVRRCEDLFGSELRGILRMKGDEQYHDPQVFNKRDEQPIAQGQNKKTQHEERSFMQSQQRRQQNEVPDKYPMSSSRRFHEDGNKYSTQEAHVVSNHIDLTDHVVWDNDVGKNYPSNLKPNGTDVTVPETWSNASSDFTGSEVYDIIIDPAQRENEDTEKQNETKFDSKTENDDKSVASMYSISREKSIRTPESKNRKIVKVKAPETLPGNFMFEARINDDIFMVHVVSKSVQGLH